MIKLTELYEKFKDKGEEQAFHWFVLSPPPYTDYKYSNKEIYDKIVQQVYGEEWEYWNTWIDYQKHR